MTTTINLNFLNFFGLGPDKNAAYTGVRSDERSSEKRRDRSSSGERIIDVTPYSRAAYSEEKDIPQIESGSRSAGLAIPHNVIARTYDRKGKSVQFIYQKGLHVDSYV